MPTRVKGGGADTPFSHPTSTQSRPETFPVENTERHQCRAGSGKGLSSKLPGLLCGSHETVMGKKDNGEAYAGRCPNGAVACQRQGSTLASVLPGFSSARPFWLERGTLLGEKVSLACACDERSNDCCGTDSRQAVGIVVAVRGQSRGGCGQGRAILGHVVLRCRAAG